MTVVPAHPISGLPEIGTLGAHVGYSRHAMGTHIPEAIICGAMVPAFAAMTPWVCVCSPQAIRLHLTDERAARSRLRALARSWRCRIGFEDQARIVRDSRNNGRVGRLYRR